MKLRACITSHFISAIEDGMVRKVHNRDSQGTPIVKFKKLADIYKSIDTEHTGMFQNNYNNTESNDDITARNEHTNLPFADRKTKDEDEPEWRSNEDSCDELTLSQLKKKSKRKKRKVLESVSTLKTEYDDSDLSEPLFKFKVKVPKTSQSKKTSFPGIVNVKVEAPEMEYTECNEITHLDDVSFHGPATFIASESGVIFVNNEQMSKNSDSFEDEMEVCGLNEASFGVLNGNNMVLDNEEILTNVNQSISDVSSLEDDSPVEDVATSISDSFESQPEQVNYISDVQDSVNADVDLSSLNSDNSSFVSDETPVIQEQPFLVLDNSDSEVKNLNHDYQTDIINEESDCIEPRHTERLPSTRKAISPTSQEKLCLAMKSEELLDDMDRYKCKEKLSFEEQPENKSSSNVHPQEVKFVISPKNTLKKPKSVKKISPPEKYLPPKGCLDGPRLCRSLPRLSTGCTTVEGCSESAIAFSQRQMRDIESLASKLMTELNSMKVIVEEKLLFEAYRSTSLKNEADEVKAAIKSATKTEETAKKWLSMMARDSSRFCKIMKLSSDNITSASDSVDPATGSGTEEKAVQKERKKISFADEAGGALCDIKVYQIDQSSSDVDQKQESLLE